MFRQKQLALIKLIALRSAYPANHNNPINQFQVKVDGASPSPTPSNQIHAKVIVTQ